MRLDLWDIDGAGPNIRFPNPCGVVIDPTGELVEINYDEGMVMNRISFTSERHSIRITVLPGFITDGASIPRFFWRVIDHPWTLPVLLPAIIHDGLYRTRWLDEFPQFSFSKAVADNVFSEAMVSIDTNIIKRGVIYGAVHTLGHWSYFDKKNAIEKARPFVQVENVVHHNGAWVPVEAI